MKPPAEKDSVIIRYMESINLLERTLAGLKKSDLDRVPAKGGWSIRQIVHHLADGDDLWKICIKQAIGKNQTEFSLEWYRTLPQDTWTDRWAYGQRPVEISLALLRAIRDHVKQLLEYVPDAWQCTAKFRKPDHEIEIIPVGFIIEMQANHVEHHVKQIEKIIKENRDTHKQIP